MDRRTLRPLAAAAVVLLGVLPACRSAGDGRVPGAAALAPTPAPTPAATPRQPTRLDINTTAPTRRKVARAVRDLKRVGVWKRLVTPRLYVIEIQARLGSGEIPDDEHLADASLSAFIDEHGGGAHCFILFYPAAIRHALERWDAAAAGGYARWQPPSERDFWAAILAHELAHCQKGQPGEKFAYRWTGKAFEALGRHDLVPYAEDVYRWVKEQESEG